MRKHLSVCIGGSGKDTNVNNYYADLHMHVGYSHGRPVKITASRALTIDRIIAESAIYKGMDVIGIIDAICPPVHQELSRLCEHGLLHPLCEGGLRYVDPATDRSLTILLGGEIEIAGPNGGAAHFGVWFPDLHVVADFQKWYSHIVTNPNLSSQRANCSGYALQEATIERGGLFIVNHAFTPHKGLYGRCATHMGDMVDPSKVTALELGLSSDSDMADLLSELGEITFVSNSDAHSLPKIAREYNVLKLCEPSFAEVSGALLRQGGRGVVANYGLEPRLGKYHRTYCANCEAVIDDQSTYRCPDCGLTSIVQGVWDRIQSIADRDVAIRPSHRPPYNFQVPLQFIPKLGPKTLRRLLQVFGTEMNVLHDATSEQLIDVVGIEIAQRIMNARAGTLHISVGGGGRYGKVI